MGPRRLVPVAPLPFAGAPYLPPTHDSVAMARALSSRPPPYAPAQGSASHLRETRESRGVAYHMLRAVKPLAVSWSLVGALAFTMVSATADQTATETLLLQPVRIHVAQSEPLEALTDREDNETASTEDVAITQPVGEVAEASTAAVPSAAGAVVASADTGAVTRAAGAGAVAAPARVRRPRRETVRPNVAPVAPVIAAAPTNEPPRVTQMRTTRRAPRPAARAPERRQATPQTALPEQPTRAQVRAGLQSVRGAVQSCAPGATGSVRVRVSIAGSGRVTTALVQDQRWARPPYGSCIARAIRTATFPRFEKDRLVVVYPFRF